MVLSTPPEEPVQKLPVWITVVEAFNFVFGNLGLLFRAALTPFLISIVIAILTFRFQLSLVQNIESGAPNILLIIAVIALAFVAYILFSVAWFRTNLLGSSAGYPPLFPSVRSRHRRSLGYLLLLLLIVLVLMLGMQLVLSVVVKATGSVNLYAFGIALVFFLLVFYVGLRLFFVFPAIAVDEVYGFRNSWSHTHGQGLRLLGAFVATTIAAAVSAGILNWIISRIFEFLFFSGAELDTASQNIDPKIVAEYLTTNAVPIVMLQIILQAINYIVFGVSISLIAIAFRSMTGWVPHAGPPAASNGDASVGDST